ncbi:MAG: AAA family ATPase [Coxiellaceae bacterium]|nr:AAA family ATPase [Coxiellaceae bacterium]
MFKRLLKITLPAGQSAFLWGARQTGKSTYLENHYPKATLISLLQSDVFLAYSKQPSLLRDQVLSYSEQQLQQPVILDEVQKVPALLDEVHWLIEHTNVQFILCGSSARKLRRQGINLLGGRAWKFHFYPLVSAEIGEVDLLKAFNNGLLPPHYLATQPQRRLQSYLEDYLTQEIKEEGLVRNLPQFARFLDSLAFTNGEMVKYSNIARDCGVDAKTVQNYFEILVDTLLGYYVMPYAKRVSRDIIRQTPKFYLFDVGVANYLAKKQINQLKGPDAGKSLEQFILMELTAYKGLREKRFDICYWRTKTGLEVDFVLNAGEIAIEVKIKNLLEKSDIKGLIAFCNEHHPKQAIVVSQDQQRRKIIIDDHTHIDVIPWREFLKLLWDDQYELS